MFLSYAYDFFVVEDLPSYPSVFVGFYFILEHKTKNLDIPGPGISDLGQVPLPFLGLAFHLYLKTKTGNTSYHWLKDFIKSRR